MNSDISRETAPDNSPSAFMYLVPVAIFFAGIAYAGYYTFEGIMNLNASIIRSMMPGTAPLDLAGSGSYTVFYEYETQYEGKSFSNAPRLKGMSCGLVSTDTGEEVKLHKSTANVNYSIGSYKGIAIFNFIISQPGAYDLTCGYDAGAEGPDVVIAISQGFMSSFFKVILSALGFAGLAIVLATLIFIWILAMRSGRKKRSGSPPPPPSPHDGPRPVEPR